MRTLTTEAGELLLVEVPENAEVSIEGKKITYVDYWHKGVVTYIVPPIREIDLPEGYNTILGEITKDGPQFECDKLVSSYQDVYFVDYVTGTSNKASKEESFIGVLYSNDIYLVNPILKSPIELWEKAESNTLKEGHKFIALLKHV